MAHAERYAAFLASAKTPRRAVRALVALAVAAGATPLPEDAGTRPAPGSRFLLVHPGGDAVALLVVGRRPIDEGVRGVVAALDAPRLDVKQNPLLDQAGLTLFDTLPVGTLDEKQWLAYPLALYAYSARPGSAAGPVDLSIGDHPDDPVLAISDLLPHLAYTVQSKAIVDDPERLNAIAASERGALLAFLAAHGLDEGDLATTELSLVPAGPPQFVGPDRGLLHGYGHTHRALAYDAASALIGAPVPTYTSMLIAVSKEPLEGTGSTGLAFVSTALGRAVAHLAGPDANQLRVLQIHARSALLAGAVMGGKLGSGVAMNPRSSDALPDVLRLFLAASPKALVQVEDEPPSGGSPSRQLGTLGLSALDVSIPASGRGSPLEIVSALDLYQGYLLCQGWFGHAPAETK
jgi:aspartyl aminopeptidase